MVDHSRVDHEGRATPMLYTIVADGAAPITIPVTTGLAGAAYMTGTSVNVADAYQDARFNKAIDLKTGYRTKSVLCFPIHNSRDEVIAVIQLINKGGMKACLRFNDSDEELVAAFCAQLAVSIENVLAIDEMNQSQEMMHKEKARMHTFLDVVGMIVQGLPAHEVCQKAQKAATECTNSLGAALYVCADHAPVASRIDGLDEQAFEDTLASGPFAPMSPGAPGLERQASSGSFDEQDGGSPGSNHSFSFKFSGGGKQAEPELTQLVPELTSGSWAAVQRLSQNVLLTNSTLDDDVDINDNGLPEALRVHTAAPRTCLEPSWTFR